MRTRLIAGCGYVGSRIAEKWLAAGDSVFAFTRSTSRCEALNAMGIQAILWDWNSEQGPNPSANWELLLDALANHRLATILVAVSHASVAGVDPAQTHALGLANTWKSLGGNLVNTSGAKWIYLSTTGVFGETEPGAWVDERSPVSPTRPGAQAAWGGEKWISQNIQNGNAVCLRPAGIYGPNRVPRWQSIRDRIPIDADPNSFLNLIHVEDLVSVIYELSNRDAKQALYCVADQEPVQRRVYFEFISQIASLPAPVYAPVLEPPVTPSRQRREGSKRINNDRLVQEFNFEFRFPTFRDGLPDLLREAMR